jgi:hypothetical protein
MRKDDRKTKECCRLSTSRVKVVQLSEKLPGSRGVALNTIDHVPRL